LVQALEEVNHEQAQLKEQEEHALRESKLQFQEMEEVIRECEELEIEIARNNKLQSAAREEAAALKKKANDLKDQVATAVWALQEAEAEEEKLRLQIVTSPDRRKSEMYVRKERLRKVKEECADLENAVQECKTKVVNAMQALQDLDTTNVLLDDLQEEANKDTELVRKIEETRKRYHASDKKTAEVHKLIEETTRQLARAEEKIVHQRKQHKLQIDAAQEALEMAKSQLLRVEKERRQGMARVEAGEMEVKAIEAAIDQERAKTEAEIQSIVAEYKQVETAFLERNEKRMAALQQRAH
jgi:DNA repair exonuclease SbcCD ATPase subunit